MRLKLDENLGRSALDLLRPAGHDTRSVIDERLQGTPDRSLIETCRAERRCLVTLDLEFGNPILFPPEDFAGIAVLRPDRLTEKALAAGACRAMEADRSARPAPSSQPSATPIQALAGEATPTH